MANDLLRSIFPVQYFIFFLLAICLLEVAMLLNVKVVGFTEKILYFSLIVGHSNL